MATIVVFSSGGASARCGCCNAVVRYHPSDIKENLLEATTWAVSMYVCCPECGNMITVGKKEVTEPSCGQSTV